VTLPANATLTSGTGTFTATLATVGNQTITATDTSNASITGTSGEISVASGKATHFTVVAASPETAGAPFTVTVTALDVNNNVAKGYRGTASLTSTDPLAGVVGTVTFTAADAGVALPSVTLKTATLTGWTITATDSVNVITGASGYIVVKPGPATHFSVVAPSSATSGASFNFNVTALDAYGNTVTAYAGTVTFASSDHNIGVLLPSAATLTNGKGTFSATLATAGNQTITARQAGGGFPVTGTSGPITVAPGVATHFLLAVPSRVTSEVPFTVIVTARDAAGNVATGFTGTVALTSNDPNAMKLGTTAFTSGDKGTASALVTLVTPSSAGWTITVSNGAYALYGKSTPVIVVAGPATHLKVTAASPQIAGKAFQITITALDANGYTATGYAGTVLLKSNDPAAANLGSITFGSGNAGIAKPTVTLKTPTATGSTVTAVDSKVPSVTGSSGLIVVNSPV
jgi:hypothetical protein